MSIAHSPVFPPIVLAPPCVRSPIRWAGLGVPGKHHEIELLYQPQVVWPSRSIIGVEALVRLRDTGSQRLLSPGVWLASVDGTPRILDIGAEVVRQAIRSAADWHDAGQLLRVSINLAALQVMDPGLVTCVEDAFTDNPTARRDLIEFEVTETHPLTDLPRAARNLSLLRALGCGVAIDDFGSGFTNFQWLRELPVSALKVDRTYIASMLSDGRSAAIVESCARIARAFDISIIAEGVESEAEARRLAELGYEQMQGFLFFQPMSADAVRALDAHP